MNTQAITKRDIAERGIDALDLDRQAGIIVSGTAGGVSFATVTEVIEVAKLMSAADKAVPVHLRANPGACLRIVFQAVEWRMSPWAVADKSYLVNDRIAYESQLVHAVIEARAPLKERLDCRYEGEGTDKRCIVIGTFRDGTKREYISPSIKDIRVKNSPLWTADPDQQLFYYSSRSWARKWAPDVLMGIYSRDELAANPNLGRDEEPASGLHQRLIEGKVDRSEGHQDGHTAENIEQAKNGEKPQRKRKTKPAPSTDAEKSEEKVSQALPRNPREWETYCRLWIEQATDAESIKTRWDSERALRNQCGVTEEVRKPVQELMAKRRKELGGHD